MNKRKILMGGMLTLFIFSWGIIPEGYAQPTSTEISAKLAARLNRQKTRKVAAKRLKIVAEKNFHDALYLPDGKPKGFKANGFTGEGKSGNKKKTKG